MVSLFDSASKRAHSKRFAKSKAPCAVAPAHGVWRLAAAVGVIRARVEPGPPWNRYHRARVEAGLPQAHHWPAHLTSASRRRRRRRRGPVRPSRPTRPRRLSRLRSDPHRTRQHPPILGPHVTDAHLVPHLRVFQNGRLAILEDPRLGGDVHHRLAHLDRLVNVIDLGNPPRQRSRTRFRSSGRAGARAPCRSGRLGRSSFRRTRRGHPAPEPYRQTPHDKGVPPPEPGATESASQTSQPETNPARFRIHTPCLHIPTPRSSAPDPRAASPGATPHRPS